MANDRILDAAANVSNEHLTAPSEIGWGSLRGALVHLLDAEYIWRILLEDGIDAEAHDPGDFCDVAGIRARWAEVRGAFWNYLKQLSDEELNTALDYDALGGLRRQALWRMLVHVVNHGTQHRAECAALLTGFGYSPGDVDFPFFLNSSRSAAAKRSAALTQNHKTSRRMSDAVNVNSRSAAAKRSAALTQNRKPSRRMSDAVYVNRSKHQNGGAMNFKDIELLFKYNDWANERILGTAENASTEQLIAPDDLGWGSLRGALVHLMDAEYAWRNLLKDGVFIVEFNPEDFPDVAAIRARWADERTAFWDYLNSLSNDDLADIIKYEADGKTRQRVLWHCLAHVVNHGTQHRSECAAILTGFGHSPGNLDFTVFLSER